MVYLVDLWFVTGGSITALLRGDIWMCEQVFLLSHCLGITRGVYWAQPWMLNLLQEVRAKSTSLESVR